MKLSRSLNLTIALLLAVRVLSGQNFPDTMIGGQHYYLGSPTSFMVLPNNSSAIANSWVKPSYGSSYSNPTATTGIMYSSTTNFSHRFITQQGTDCDACYQMGTTYIDQQILPPAWDSDVHPGTYVDTVIQIGSPGSQGENSQQIEYRFIPDRNNPVLLLNFMFVLENKTTGSHSYSTNPRVDIEVLNGVTNQRLNLGNYPNGYPNPSPGAAGNPNWPYSRFYIIAPGDGTGDHSQCTPVNVNSHICPLSEACHGSSDIQNVLSYQYTIVAFNLKEQAQAHTPVILRLKVRACDYSAHWAYCYYTAKMVPSELKVDYCTGDPAVHLTMPWGFDAQNYHWYNGTDNQHYSSAPSVEELEGYPYSFFVDPDPANPYWRCEAVSYTGVPFVYEATVNYIALDPSFTVSPGIDSCKYNVRINNTSTIVKYVPNGNGGVDTLPQDLHANPNLCHWDFGDGSHTTGFHPYHTYNDVGPYTIKMFLTDLEGICESDTVQQVIEYSTDHVTPHYTTDTVSTCESKLPYYYQPELFGYENVETKWDLNAVGDRTVNYSHALPEFTVKSSNGCDSIARVRFDVLTPSVVIEQDLTEDFCDSAQTYLYANVVNANERSIAYSWVFMDSVISRGSMMRAYSDGTYTVSVVDTATGCAAETSHKIDPCVPNIFLANCITPTDDRSDLLQNDYIYLDGFVLRFITDIKFMVYSRNGEQVYYYEGKKNAGGVFEPTPAFENLPTEMDGRLVLWDGRSHGKIETGVYAYSLWIVSGNQQYMYKGKITVL